MKTFAKYLLFEIPQWFLLALILWVLVETTDLPVWAVQGFFVVWVLKDLALFPLVRNAYENNAKTGTEQLIGVKATTQDRLDPEGFVRIHGVLWKARAEPADQPINRDTVVTVCAARGLTLIVQTENRQAAQNISFKA
ncbi:MAG TPA: NfeD family protein [Candidatus Binatia bacterium]|nr:NfeD family protein [Candidatus Binatia bacterium]